MYNHSECFAKLVHHYEFLVQGWRFWDLLPFMKFPSPFDGLLCRGPVGISGEPLAPVHHGWLDEPGHGLVSRDERRRETVHRHGIVVPKYRENRFIR